ncbi:amidohydrolase family protein [Hymenobacter elongatus]|uniref:Amidohydrolase n=1 Tax=Hymenobacter elongatus TaxID=877208 RepID=A0A4Z0PNF1_9BACT|nr:amidohydrolase family protein [Hymenobacter elongatus]TGE17549.1 amidohydrolase [Hymenobacter elongatus]
MAILSPGFRSFASSILAGLLVSGTSPRPAETYDLVITHLNVVDVQSGRIRPDHTLAISGGIIRRIEPGSTRIYAAKKTLDGKARYVIPGLWDMHMHFRGGDSLTQAAKNTLPLFLAHGVTTVRDAGGDLTAAIFSWRQQIKAGTLPGPRIFTSGPKIDGPQAYWPGSLEVETPVQITKALDSLQKLRVDYIKIYDSKISREAYLQVVAEAQKRGLKTTSHMPFTVKLSEAIAQGLDATEHLYYVFKGCSSKEDSLTALVTQSLRTPKPLGLFAVLPALYDTYDVATANRLFKLMAAKKTAVVPTLFIQKTLAEVATADHTRDSLLAFISPKIQATYARRVSSARQQSATAVAFGQKLNARFMTMVPQLQAAGVLVLAGSDSGPFNSYVYPGASLQGELQMLVAAGLTPLQALRAATINGATFMGVEKTSGTLAVGKDADLVILRQNPLENIANIKKIDAVVTRGTLYSAADLDRLVQAVRNK